MRAKRLPTKCREWEKQRRDRLNNSFGELHKVLPTYDPSKNPSKSAIIEESIKYIKELDEKLKALVNPVSAASAERDEIKAWRTRYQKLLLRHEQLAKFIKDAGIRAPIGYGIPFRTYKVWNNRVTPEQAAEFARKEAQKENDNSTVPKRPKKPKSRLKKSFPTTTTRPIKKVISQKLKNSTRGSPTATGIQLPSTPSVLNQQPQPYYIITNPPCNNFVQLARPATSTVVTSTTSLATPRVTAMIEPTATNMAKPQSALVLSNPVPFSLLPQIPTVLQFRTVLANAPSVLINNSLKPVVVTNTSKPASVTALKKTETLTTTTAKPKVARPPVTIRPKKAVTKTVHMNKVPIPALTSRYSNTALIHSSSVSVVQDRKVVVVKKKVVKPEKQNEAEKRVAVKEDGPSAKKAKVCTLQEQTSISKENNPPQTTSLEEAVKQPQSTNKSDGSATASSDSIISAPIDEHHPVELQPASHLIERHATIVETPTTSLPIGDQLQTSISNAVGLQTTSNTSERVEATAMIPKVTNLIEQPATSTSTTLPSVRLAKLSSKLVTDAAPVLPSLQFSEVSEALSSSIKSGEEALMASRSELETLSCSVKTTRVENQTSELGASKAESEKDTEKNVNHNRFDDAATKHVDLVADIGADDKHLELGIALNHSELSNDIFSSLQVPIGSQNPESTSPTAAFLLAFPLVSTLTGVKVTEVIEDDNLDSRHGTPTLLQIGTMEPSKTTQTVPSDSLTPSLLNLDSSFSFFSGKDLYSSFDHLACSTSSSFPPVHLPCSTSSNFQPGNLPCFTSSSAQPIYLSSSTSSSSQPVNLPCLPGSNFQPGNLPCFTNSSSQPIYLSSSTSSSSQPVHLVCSTSSSSQPIYLSSSIASSSQPVNLPCLPRSNFQPGNLPCLTTSSSQAVKLPCLPSSNFQPGNLSCLTTPSSQPIYLSSSISSSSQPVKLPCLTSSNFQPENLPCLTSSSSQPMYLSSSTSLSSQPVHQLCTTSSSSQPVNLPCLTSSKFQPGNLPCLTTSSSQPIYLLSSTGSSSQPVNLPCLTTSSSQPIYLSSSISSSSQPLNLPCLPSSNFQAGNLPSLTTSSSQPMYLSSSTSSSSQPIHLLCSTSSSSQPMYLPSSSSSSSKPVHAPRLTSSGSQSVHLACSTNSNSQPVHLPGSSGLQLAVTTSDFSVKTAVCGNPPNLSKDTKPVFNTATKNSQEKQVQQYNRTCQPLITCKANSQLKVAPVYSNYQPFAASSDSTHYPVKQKNVATSFQNPTYDFTASTSYVTTQYNLVTTIPSSASHCNTFNPFADFSKPNTIPSHVLSRSYPDPLYTNSTNYNYNQQQGDNLAQNYPRYNSTKAATATHNTMHFSSNYNMDCSGDGRKQEQGNHNRNICSSSNYYNQHQQPKGGGKEKFNPHSPKGAKSGGVQTKPPINWMTTPDLKQQQPSNTDFLLPDYSSNVFYPTNSFNTTKNYFNANTSAYPMAGDFSENRPSVQKADDENQFSWSPTKLPQFIEAPHTFVPSTLPTLVGDLALGTALPHQPFIENKIETPVLPDKEHLKRKEANRRSKVPPPTNFDGNFLSVSQLVENKTSGMPARPANRRNSGSRSSKNVTQKTSKRPPKQSEVKEQVDQNYSLPKLEQAKQANVPPTGYPVQNTMANWLGECSKQTPRHVQKNNYSAEALIGHPSSSDTSIQKHNRYRQQTTNYPNPTGATTSKPIPPVSSFLSENIVSYFPTVEISQDNFIQSNQGYQNVSVQNTMNCYSTAVSTITSTYLPPSNFMPADFALHEYGASSIVTDNSSIRPPTKSLTRNSSNQKSQPIVNMQAPPNQPSSDCSLSNPNTVSKKSRNNSKSGNESNLALVDFGFLGMPSGAISSPILPDDFHTHSNFLPAPAPTQLYPCKNPLYPKQTSDLNSSALLPLPPVPPVCRSTTQHFEVAPPAVSNMGSSSLTSFNLSAIFPEINKSNIPIAGMYPEHTRKNYSVQSNYLNNPVQVPFSNKLSTITTYANSVSYAQTD